ncbi:MAG TPA: SURF1 family cytochrome oxidase biogenesis protein [Xanthobacteraceae bacterium]|nr:SURF1 family cytochrome oxidase biogenesis protein [Xanthobacteraceae bacterium]
MTAARQGLLLPAIAAALAFAVLVGLGTWQLERRQWKHALIDVLTQRVNAAPTALPAKQRWGELTAENDEFRRVMFHAELAPNEQALVFTVGSRLRPDVSGPGYWVFAPARLADGGAVVVNRGFVPADRLDVLEHVRQRGEGAAATAIIGYLRWPEARGWFTPRDEPARNVWYVRDHRLIAAAKGWGEVGPFYVDQEGPAAPGGLPRPGPLAIALPDDHLQYALTWYGLAAVLAVVFAVWAHGRLRPGRQDGG